MSKHPSLELLQRKKQKTPEPFIVKVKEQIQTIAETAAASYVQGLLAQKTEDQTVFEQINRKIGDVQQILDVLEVIKGKLEMRGENDVLEREVLTQIKAKLAE